MKRTPERNAGLLLLSLIGVVWFCFFNFIWKPV